MLQGYWSFFLPKPLPSDVFYLVFLLLPVLLIVLGVLLHRLHFSSLSIVHLLVSLLISLVFFFSFSKSIFSFCFLLFLFLNFIIFKSSPQTSFLLMSVFCFFVCFIFVSSVCFLFCCRLKTVFVPSRGCNITVFTRVFKYVKS